MKKTIIITLLSLLLIQTSFAYIDPGTGGMIIGSIWPVIIAFFSAVCAFLVKIFWNPIKNIFLKILNRAK